jgi:hypothetical protein
MSGDERLLPLTISIIDAGRIATGAKGNICMILMRKTPALCGGFSAPGSPGRDM